MKMSEYAAQHKNDGQKVDIKTFVAASTLVGETIEIREIAYIEKTKFDNPAYIVKISDETGFFTTASLTRQIDKFIKGGVSLDDIVGCRFKILQEHLDAKDGRKECDFLQFEFVDEGESE